MLTHADHGVCREVVQKGRCQTRCKQTLSGDRTLIVGAVNQGKKAIALHTDKKNNGQRRSPKGASSLTGQLAECAFILLPQFCQQRKNHLAQQSAGNKHRQALNCFPCNAVAAHIGISAILFKKYDVDLVIKHGAASHAGKDEAVLHVTGQIFHAIKANTCQRIALQGQQSKNDAQHRFHRLVQGNHNGRGPNHHADDAKANTQQCRRHTDAHFHILPTPRLAERKKRIAHAVQPKASCYAHDHKPQLWRIVLPTSYKPCKAEGQNKHNQLEPGDFTQQGQWAPFAPGKC